MSLDVYLTTNEPVQSVGTGIFIRENGQTRQITREEWDSRYPGREPVVASQENDYVYHGNITHNLYGIAKEAGIVDHLWQPEEIGITTAGLLIQPLMAGLARLRAEPERFKAFNPKNGWGNYEGLVQFVEDYLIACQQYPDATVRAWR